MNPGPDPQLLEQIRSGNTQAFAHLYDRYRHRVFQYCDRLLNDRQLAEDVVQNVFIKFHTQQSTIRNGESLQHWFFTVARNDSFAELRKKRLEAVHDDILWDGELPDEAIQNKERRQIVELVLQQLHAPYREAIVLREYEQMSYEEIASITGTTVSSVKSRLFKARKALIEKLKPYL
ncbi:MAG: sigma-70 family RNA polymerase sigma factor [Bacteroidota bacterium]